MSGTPCVAALLKSPDGSMSWARSGPTGKPAWRAFRGNYTRQKIDRDRWAQCPNCGSIKVKTVPKWGFVPSAARAQPPSPARPAATLVEDRVLEHGQLSRLSSDTSSPSSAWARVGALTGRALIAWWTSPVAVVVVMVLLAFTGVVEAFTASPSTEPKSVGDRIGSVACQPLSWGWPGGVQSPFVAAIRLRSISSADVIHCIGFSKWWRA
jgi:hypothetical protein